MQGVSGDTFQNMEIMGYAPADFPDSEDTRPPESYLDTGSSSPATLYSSLITNTLQRQSRDIRDRHVSPINYANNWKRKVRDIFLRGNETVLAFLTKPTSAHPTFSQVESLIRRYSTQEPIHRDTHHQLRDILRDWVTDLSGEDSTAFLNERLARKIQNNPTVNLAEQVREVYEVYREIMEEIGRTDSALQQKLAVLDHVQPRLVTLMGLGVDENTAELEAQIEIYLTRVYQKNNPEPEYKKLLSLYKKFMIVRDLVQLLRVSAGPEKEPICGICLTETVTHALVPCGHTYCDGCVRRQQRQCFVCRQGATQIIKVFFT